MTIGFDIIIILILGYITVYIRENWLKAKWLKPLTWLGIFIHESCHALASIITGGKVASIKVTSTEGSVSHYPSKVPVIGPMLVALAPLIGGVIIIGSLNYFWLKANLGLNSTDIIQVFKQFLASLDFFSWQILVWLALCLNVGVMLGPSKQDLKNIWLLVVISFFIKSLVISQVLTLVIVLMLINTLLFIILSLIKKLF
jgi:hypothetical protein